MNLVIYYPGTTNVAQSWDDSTDTYTAYDQSGNVTTTRPFTADETARAQAIEASLATSNNRSTLTNAAANAIANNQTFLGLASPTAAQELSQLQALTRQVNALIRLVTNDLSSTAGT